MKKNVSKRPMFLYAALFLFVLLPLARLTQSEAAASIRSVDFVTIFAAGMAFGALLSMLIVRWRRIPKHPAEDL